MIRLLLNMCLTAAILVTTGIIPAARTSIVMMCAASFGRVLGSAEAVTANERMLVRSAVGLIAATAEGRSGPKP